jgi:RNA polymerase sigma-70 factor, ECF subfamily
VSGKSRENQWALLLAAANAGDTGAYRQFLLQLTPVLRAFARKCLAGAGLTDTDAEDIVQETLLAIHLKRQSWDSAVPASPWIWAIARHKLIDNLRRRGGRVHPPVEDYTEMLTSKEEEPDRLIAGVDRHLETLSPGQRSVLRAIAIDGASIGEAAGRLSISPGAVRVALHRGLKALAAKLNAEAK